MSGPNCLDPSATLKGFTVPFCPITETRPANNRNSQAYVPSRAALAATNSSRLAALTSGYSDREKPGRR